MLISPGFCFCLSQPHYLGFAQLHLSLSPFTELFLFLLCFFPPFFQGQEKQC